MPRRDRERYRLCARCIRVPVYEDNHQNYKLYRGKMCTRGELFLMRRLEDPTSPRECGIVSEVIFEEAHVVSKFLLGGNCRWILDKNFSTMMGITGVWFFDSIFLKRCAVSNEA